MPRGLPPPWVPPPGLLAAGQPGKAQAPLGLPQGRGPLHRLVGAAGAKAGERTTSMLATFLLTSQATPASGWNPPHSLPVIVFMSKECGKKGLAGCKGLSSEPELACGSSFLTNCLGIGGLTHTSHKQKHPALQLLPAAMPACHLQLQPRGTARHIWPPVQLRNPPPPPRIERWTCQPHRSTGSLWRPLVMGGEGMAEVTIHLLTIPCTQSCLDCGAQKDRAHMPRHY